MKNVFTIRVSLYGVLMCFTHRGEKPRTEALERIQVELCAKTQSSCVNGCRRPSTEGRTCCLVGKTLSTNCFAPTVLFDQPIDVRVSTQEIFGPVVSVYPFDEIDAAINLANGLPYAFQATVFTRDLDTALRAATRLDAFRRTCRVRPWNRRDSLHDEGHANQKDDRDSL